MGSFGDYAKQTFANGVSPVNPTTFQPMENKIEDIDNELAYSGKFRFSDLKKYFWMRNCKDIADFTDDTDWTGVGCLVGIASISICGNSGTSILDSDDTGSTIYMHNTIASIDLTKFNDESASTTSDVIVYSCYLFNSSYIDDLTIKLGDDNANYFYYTWSTVYNKQSTYQAKKSSFTQSGTPSGWDDITYIQIEATTLANANANIAFVVPLILSIFRNDPDTDGQGQPFQFYSGSAWSNFFTQSNNVWNLLFDPKYNSLGIQCLDDYNDSGIWNGLKVKTSAVSFVWKSVMNAYYNDYSSNMTWYIDANNYATCWIDNDDFTLKVVEASAATTYTFSLNTSLAYGELLEIKLEKNVSTIRATLEKGNERIAVLEHLTTITSTTAGDLYYGFDTIGLCLITDFEISNVNNILLDNWDKPKLVIKKDDESTDTDTTLSNDSELYAYLPPNSMFHVHMNIGVICSSNTPDVKFDWSTTGITLIGNRHITAPSVSITTIVEAESMRQSVATSLSDARNAGLDTDAIANIQDVFVIRTGTIGGSIALRWAQNVSDGASVTVSAGSFIKFTKCDLLQRND